MISEPNESLLRTLIIHYHNVSIEIKETIPPTIREALSLLGYDTPLTADRIKPLIDAFLMIPFPCPAYLVKALQTVFDSQLMHASRLLHNNGLLNIETIDIVISQETTEYMAYLLDLLNKAKSLDIATLSLIMSKKNPDKILEALDLLDTAGLMNNANVHAVIEPSQERYFNHLLYRCIQANLLDQANFEALIQHQGILCGNRRLENLLSALHPTALRYHFEAIIRHAETRQTSQVEQYLRSILSTMTQSVIDTDLDHYYATHPEAAAKAAATRKAPGHGSMFHHPDPRTKVIESPRKCCIM